MRLRIQTRTARLVGRSWTSPPLVAGERILRVTSAMVKLVDGLTVATGRT
jgi:hypothetical protein